MNVITVATTIAETVVLTVSPSGGQRTARHNALAAAEADAVAAQERAEAAAALSAAVPKARTPRQLTPTG